jgi:hypothetical protein
LPELWSAAPEKAPSWINAKPGSGLAMDSVTIEFDRQGALSEGEVVFPNRKAFKFQITPSDRQLWAIGTVAITWTLLENLLQTSAHAIAGADSPEKEKYEETRSFKIRLDILEALVGARVKSPHRERLLSMVVEIRNLQLQRDRIIHGSWGDGREPAAGPEARGAFNWLKPHPPFEWKLNFGDIMAVALRIDEMTYRWVNTALDGATGDPILLSEALRQKLCVSRD